MVLYRGTLKLWAASWPAYHMFSGSIETIARMTNQEKVLVYAPDGKTWSSVEWTLGD